MISRFFTHILAFCLFVSFQSALFGQSFVIDSLQAKIESKSVGSGDRILAMGELSKILSAENKIPEALDMAHQALGLSWKENDKKYSANTQSILGYIYVKADSLAKAIESLDSASIYAEQISDRKIKAYVNFRMGWLDLIQNDIESGYENMLTALNLLDGLGEYSSESNIYHYLASIYNSWKDPEKQFYYTKLCLEAAIISNDPDAISNAYLSMGSSYLNKYRHDENSGNFLDSAIYFTQLSLKASQSKHIGIRSTQAAASLNLANIYLEFFKTQQQDSATFYAKKAISIAKEVNYPEIIANGYGIMSEFSLIEGHFKEAETLLNKALEEVQDSPRASPIISFRVYNALAKLAEKNNDFKKALQYYRKQQEYHEKLFDKEKLAAVQQLETKYQSEKKELALATAEKEAAFNKILNRIYILTIVLGALGIFFFYRSYMLRLKSSHQKQIILEKEKKTAQLQADYKEQERARLQAERKLLQERYGKMEKELLAGNLQVEEKNKLVEMLKDRLAVVGKKDPLFTQIEKLISQNTKIDQGYDEIKSEMDEVQLGFVEKLQEKSEHHLTRLDLKYCSYILMGLSNKEIANKLNIDPKSIRMAKYRIKQKLKLTKEEDLTQFIIESNSSASKN